MTLRMLTRGAGAVLHGHDRDEAHAQGERRRVRRARERLWYVPDATVSLAGGHRSMLTVTGQTYTGKDPRNLDNALFVALARGNATVS